MRFLPEVLEMLGFLAIACFAFILWPPAALATVGVGLIVAAQVIDR